MTTKTPFPMTGPDKATLPDGTPRPIDKATGKPIMTQAEANWHAHVSGMAAREQAEKSGDPVAKSAIFDGAASYTIAKVGVGGTPLLPLTLGTFEVLQMVDSAHARENPDGKSMRVTLKEMALSALIFARPDWCYVCLKDASRKDEVDDAVMQFAFHLDAPTLREVNAFIEEEMREFFGEGASAKKPDSADSPPVPVESPASLEIMPDPSADGNQR